MLFRSIGDKLEKSEDMQEQLKRFAEKAKSSKLVNFFSNPDELKSAVLVSLPSQFNLKPMRGWVRAGQTPREDLERITNLQQRILDLEAENSRLRELQDDPANRLASGSQPVSWELKLNDFVFNSQWPRIREVTLESTWDDMLHCVFPDGSYSTANNVERAIGRLIACLVPPGDGNERWWEQAKAFLNNDRHVFPSFESTRKVREELHAQFTGLGLIQESMETVYFPDHNNPFGPQIPKTVGVWRLTTKGERQLALRRGHLREVRAE